MNYNPIAIARKMRGMSQAKLADAINTLTQTVSKWESQARNISAESAANMAKVLDVDEAWIRGTAQSVPLYDPLEEVTFTCPIVRSEELPDDEGMLYHVYLAETGDVVALLLHHGLQFTATDWTNRDAQPGSAAEIADCKWMDARGAYAIMLNGMPHMFPV